MHNLRDAWDNGGMAAKPEPSADDLVRTLFQLEAAVADAQIQQMLDRLGQQTFVGGKRVPIEELPRLPKQVAFDWHGYHLHVFETVCGQFGAPDDDDDWPDRKDEAAAALAQVAAAEKAKVVYTYDFGDDWRHDIVVETIGPAEPGVAYPRCTGGRRAAPPEDCGGIWAFNEFPAALDDTFDPGEMTARLAGLAEVLIPAPG
jgi:hypothetical protein